MGLWKDFQSHHLTGTFCTKSESINQSINNNICGQQIINFIAQGNMFPYCNHDNKHFEIILTVPSVVVSFDPWKIDAKSSREWVARQSTRPERISISHSGGIDLVLMLTYIDRFYPQTHDCDFSLIQVLDGLHQKWCGWTPTQENHWSCKSKALFWSCTFSCLLFYWYAAVWQQRGNRRDFN